MRGQDPIGFYFVLSTLMSLRNWKGVVIASFRLSFNFNAKG